MQNQASERGSSSVVVVRRTDGVVTALKDSTTSGVCRVCRCVDARACPSGCTWVNKSETLCSTCTIFAYLARREVVELLFAGGYVSTINLRDVASELQEAIEDFGTLAEALGEATFERVSYATREWETPAAVFAALAERGLEVTPASERELRACA
jgi:hypothetical protein